jgi:Subtilase family
LLLGKGAAVSPNTVFPLGERPRNEVTERVIEHPRVTHHVQDDVLVLAIKDELLVHTSVRTGAPGLDDELNRIADPSGTLWAGVAGGPPSRTGDVEKWTLKDKGDHSVDHAQRLRQFTRDRRMKLGSGPETLVAGVSPNHVCIVMPFDHCPATPAHAVPPPSPAFVRNFIEPVRRGALRADVVVIDTGYIRTNPPHARLDARVKSIPGQFLGSRGNRPAWVNCPPDALDADGDGKLDGIAGHGTFIAGIIASECRQCRITAVGQRHGTAPLGPNLADDSQLFSTEYEVARSLLLHSNAQVVSCGFAFPTLDRHPSIAFASAMDAIRSRPSPGSEVAVVAPAGNEASAHPYWPAAHPDVIGVAAANRRGNGRAWFSNWGSWLDCCTRGQDVFSTFIYWSGPLDGAPPTDIEDFRGWATWNGTSFAAPKVAAAIANAYVARGGKVSPIEAYRQLLCGAAGVSVWPLADPALPGSRGVALPYLSLG